MTPEICQVYCTDARPLPAQRLTLWRYGEPVLRYAVSTALNGAGEKAGSEETPRGWHRIRAKIGKDCAPGTVFVGRRPTGECYTQALADTK